MNQQDSSVPQNGVVDRQDKLALQLPLLLIAAVFICYGRSWWNELVDFDTRWFLFRTPIGQGLTWDNFLWAFGMDTPGGWSPLTWLSHMFAISLFGEQPGPHHLLNVLLHIGNVLLLYVLLFRVTGRRWCAAMTALLLAIHPLHVEAVAWVAERSIVLALFFALTAMLAYERYCRRPGAVRYLVVLLLFALALLAKPMVVTLPAAMLLLDYWPLRRTTLLRAGLERSYVAAPIIRLLIEKLPLLALSVGSSILTVLVQKNIRGLTSVERLPVPERLTNALVSYVEYLLMMLKPNDLAAFYPYHPQPVWRVMAATAVLMAISAWVIRRRREMPWLLVGWFWYLGTFVPMIGLVHTGDQARADRYAYLPMIGIYWMIVYGAAHLVDRRMVLKRSVGGIAGAVCLGLALMCFVQVGYWRDTLTLFSHAIAVTDDNYLAHNNYAVELTARAGPGDIDAAVEHFERAIELKPNYSFALINYGRLLVDMRRPQEAIKYFAEASKTKDDDPVLFYEMAVALRQMDDLRGAIKFLGASLECDPDYEPALNLLTELRRVDPASLQGPGAQ